MAKITLTIPDTVVKRVEDAFDGTYPRQEGVSKAEHVKKFVIQYIKDVVKNYEAVKAAEAQKKSTEQDIDIT